MSELGLQRRDLDNSVGIRLFRRDWLFCHVGMVLKTVGIDSVMPDIVGMASAGLDFIAVGGGLRVGLNSQAANSNLLLKYCLFYREQRY